MPIFQNKSTEIEAFNIKLSQGAIDKNIIEILKIINSSEDYYTTSSCSGRIQLISLPKLGDKLGSKVLGKWHDPVDFEELDSSIKGWDGRDILMLLVQSPVIHLVCRNLKAASRIRNLGDASGFKYSTIRSIHKSETNDGEQMYIIVEILSTERMDIPLGKSGTLYPSGEYLRYIHELAHQCLNRSKTKLDRLETNLKKQL